MRDRAFGEFGKFMPLARTWLVNGRTFFSNRLRGLAISPTLRGTLPLSLFPRDNTSPGKRKKT